MFPAAELHLHVEGTLEPELALALADRNGLPRPAGTVAELRGRYRFSDLQSFLDVYYATMAVLRTEQDFYDLATAYLRRAVADGVRHAELSVDPQAHLSRGVPPATVFSGLTAAIADAAPAISAALVLCFLRDRPVAEAEATLTAVEPHLDGVVAVGLDSAEVGHPPSLFTGVFARARSLGLRTTAHAGEEGPPAYVRSALDDLGVERIDHGVRCIEDDDLVARLVRDRVPLTVCPLSNVRLGVVPDVAAHPLPRMLDAGLLVTVNSDDPAYFGGYLGENVAALRAAFGWDAGVLRTLAENSFRASFLPASRIEELVAEVAATRG